MQKMSQTKSILQPTTTFITFVANTIMMTTARISFLATMMSVAICVSAQKPLTIEATVPGNPEYYKQHDFSVRGGFVANSSTFFTHSNSCYVVGDNTYSKDLIDEILKSSGKTEAEFLIRWQNDESAWFGSTAKNAAYCVSFSSNTVTDSITETDFDKFDFAPNNRFIAYCKGPDLYVSSCDGSKKVNVDTGEGIVYGQSVHRDEFGIYKGTFWSESGNLLAFYRMDESMVAEYPLVDITMREAQTYPTRYPMAGETSHEVQIGIYDTESRNVIYLQTESPANRYFTNIAWTPDDRYVMVAEINRSQNHLWMNIYNSADGSFVKTLFEEESNEWVEPCTPPMFVDSKQFVWISERDGFKHLYLYNLDNTQCKQLTMGSWCVCDLYAVNRKTGEIFFQANEQGYLTRDIYKVSLKGKMTRLSDGYGVHNATFSDTGEMFTDHYSTPEYARLITLRNARNGTLIKILKDVKSNYEGYTLPIFRTVELKSADKKFDLCGVMILPADFDSTKTYPVIDYMYGGPHSQLINASWHYGTSDWKMYFAQQGYIVFSMDNRGTENRGVEYEHCIHRQLGKCEMEDQMVGVNYLKSLPYVDSTRIGIHGWSFGGFMTISMMEEHNAEFKAGVAGGPVCDWSLYEVMYGERYMDTPQENPEGYANSCVADKIGNLKGRLLVIHGDIDGTVVWQNSLKLLQNAVNADVIVDYAVYPQHEHNVVGPDRVHLFKRILQYFNDFLAR